jgi:glycosyltransferase involved in cell wall biosynthesis
MSDPLVSILIPAHNSEKWIADAIRSALDQTWDATEIIIVDDGSQDRTLSIALQFASNKTKIISQPNKGAAEARNTACLHSRGEYIQWLDADDVLDSDKIRLQVEALRLGLSKRTMISSAWGYFYHRSKKAEFKPSALWANLDPAEWMMRQMELNLHMQTATWLVSRELCDMAGPWDPRMLVDDDGEYFCRMMLSCDRIHFVPEAKTYYRRSGSSGLSYIGASDRKREAQLLSMELHINYLLSLLDNDRSRAACVRYLQNWLIHFYPDRLDLMEKASALASGLGGQLHLPKLPWKYRMLQAALGDVSARRAQMMLPKIKNDFLRTYDKALFILQRDVRKAN